MRNGNRSLVHFGIFKADLATGELRKSGRAVKLQPQPFKVLALLLERSGELVTREEIHRTLWGGDTFVDFEQGLNFAIKKIRDALGDNAERPRYIETLPRRGYRFIAPVEHPSIMAPQEEPSPQAAMPLQGRLISISQAVPAPSEPVPAESAFYEASPEAAAPRVAGPFAPVIRRSPMPVSRPAASGRPAFPWRRAAIAVGVLLLASAGALWVLWIPPSPPKVLRSVQLTHTGRAQPHGRVLTDGTRLYFTERTGGTLTLAQVPLGGGEPTIVPTSSPSSYALADIDPAGERLLVIAPSAQNEHPVWVISASGGPP